MPLTPGALVVVIGMIALLAVCGFAAVAGGQRERRAAAVMGLGWLASLSAQAAADAPDPHILLAVIDTVALMFFIGLAWRPERLWPLAVVLFQGLAVAIDVMRLITPHMHSRVYLGALAVAAWGLLASIAFGTTQSWLHRRAHSKGAAPLRVR